MFASAALLVAAVLLYVLLFKEHSPFKNFPPGPRPLPLIGNLLELNLDSPIVDLARLAKRYGSIYSLYIGSRPTVVLNGLQALKEALVVKAVDFSGRPQDMMVNHAIFVKANAPGVVLSDYGSGWREQRRFGLMTLRNFGLGKQSMEERILLETDRIVKVLKQSIDKPIDPKMLFHNAASSVICQAAHERRMELLTENKKTRVPAKPRHFIDSYLDEIEKRGDVSSSFSEDQLSAFLLDLHFARTDTTANTLLSAFLYLMNYPHVQERCQQEIDRVLQGKVLATFEDRHQMPYTQAVIHEIQRVANTVPLAVFHQTTRDTELMGYFIPKGITVIPNLSSVLSEEGQWKFPHGFHPENFLNDQEDFVKPEAFMPFSAGPRMCLGESLARMELFLITVTLLRKFRFIWPKDAGEPDYTPLFGTTQTPKPYHMKVQMRAPA